MIGVVVWSSKEREKAVIWCEDQGSLAYLQGRDSLLDSVFWPEPGDLLELDSEMVGNLRHARRVSLLSEQSCTQLPVFLRQTADPARAETHAETHLRLVSSQDRIRPSQEDALCPVMARTSAAR